MYPVQMLWMPAPMSAPLALPEAGFAASLGLYGAAEADQFAPCEASFANGSWPYSATGAGQWSWTAEAPSLRQHAQAPQHSTFRQNCSKAAAGQKQHMQSACEPEVVNLQEQSEAETIQSREMADELLMQLKSGVDAWELVQRFQHWSFSTKVSSHAAQLALEEASTSHAMLLASGLKGQVRRAAESKHANYVVQKIIEVVPIASVEFIVEELCGFGYETARHRYGCRLLLRILEHLSPSDDATRRLLDDVLVKAEEMVTHAFASYVVRHVLEFGLPSHKHRVAVALLPHVGWYAKNKLGSHVVEAAIRSCSPEDQRNLTNQLLADKDHDIAALAMNQFGRHVVRALLATPGPLRDDTEDALVRVKEQLRHSRFGRAVMHKLPTRGA